MDAIRILLVGQGGREHALAWKLSSSPRVSHIFVVPGNGGTGSGALPKVENVDDPKLEDLTALIAFAREKHVDLVVPGPEGPLVAGIQGACSAAGLPCFGPSIEAARMEGSKTFAKAFMKRHHIPTARFENFDAYEAARRHLESVEHQVVLKASGLAAGKGVIIPDSKEAAHHALEEIMVTKAFGAAGEEVVIEEFLDGDELSIISFCDGYTIKSLPAAQDHKHIFDGDQGPMTGGMGCYAPTKVATTTLMAEIHRTILQPTIDGLRKEKTPFVGILFTGIMVTSSGPRTLEYNVRFGDPETQTLLPLLETDLAELMLACVYGYLDTMELAIRPASSATVVVVAAGYPGPYPKGDAIDLLTAPESAQIFHAGTDARSGTLRTSGGRVFAVTATAAALSDALKTTYEGIASIRFPGMQYRKDIGHRAMKPPTNAKAADELTYASAGVSISAGNDLVSLIKPLVKSTARPGADSLIGGFGGVLDLAAAGYSLPPLILGAIDGVGTKLSIAHAVGKHDTVGIDCVAMNVNDLVVQGAEPLFFLDCYTCGTLDVDVAAAFVNGVARGCIQAGCALIGGETAEMPGLFTGGRFAEDGGIYDAVGAAVGALRAGDTLLPDLAAMAAGDILLGLGSSGCHSNGFSLVRKIVANAELSYTDRAPWHDEMTVGASLLEPTRIYVKSLLGTARKGLIIGMAHITGGGLVENIPRMLPAHLAAELDARRWPVPPVMRWLKEHGKVSDDEFSTVWNTGLGMVLVVKEKDVMTVIPQLEEAGETVYEIGKLVRRESRACILRGLEAWKMDT